MKNRLIAFYLPQYHPIPENDIWWGKGFTEWTNVGKAKPLFRNHYQPRVPADLGYYDLRVPEVREAQAELAKKYGIEGFCYWHYWFGNGKRLLERPFNEVLELGKPDFPFCLAWANESWRGFWHGVDGRELLIEQIYPSLDDIKLHFKSLLPAFKDKRYIQVDGKPLFMVYKPLNLPNPQMFVETWRKLAIENGFSGIHFVGQVYESAKIDTVLSLGFDSINIVRMTDVFNYRNSLSKMITRFRQRIMGSPQIISYKEASKYFVGDDEVNEKVYPTIIPNWDHSPRTGKKGLVFHGSTPELFEKHLMRINDVLSKKNNRICFIKSWNEWAEGNYMEPDLKFGVKYLETLKKILG